MEILTRRQEAKKAFLDLYAGITGFPIGLYELHEGRVQMLHADSRQADVEPHCQMIRSLPGGQALCDQDECERAQEAFDADAGGAGYEELRLCHAGLYNQTLQVKVNNVVRAVLSYGEMQIEGDEYRHNSLQRHAEVVRRLGLSDEQAERLRGLLLSAKTFSLEHLASLGTSLPKVKQWFYTLIDEEDRVQRSVEKVSHEIQTRLQAVIANAENLSVEMDTLPRDEACRRTDQLLYAALALDTVVQNLGEYLEDYRFRRQPLIPLLLEARNLYEAEARRRGIEIHITLHSDAPVLELSSHHLQLALNNLMHNAVKYSFRSGASRSRYIRISGRSDGRDYRLCFENYGVGILPEELSAGMIFEDGYQGKLTQGEYRTGSGKGLYFVKRVIERHHGRVQVESELMADQRDPEGQPHLNRFTLFLPYEQPKGETR